MGLKYDLSKIDFTKKENQTFKNWFKVMWSNSYIFLFFVNIGFLIGIASMFDSQEVFSYIGISIPILAILGIGYKAFYQYWDDLKNGTSR